MTSAEASFYASLIHDCACLNHATWTSTRGLDQATAIKSDLNLDVAGRRTSGRRTSGRPELFGLLN